MYVGVGLHPDLRPQAHPATEIQLFFPKCYSLFSYYEKQIKETELQLE